MKSNESVTRDMISCEVWKEADGVWTNVIDVCINTLRRKIERPDHRQRIHTIRGVGDNAITYTPAGGTVSVTDRTENGRFRATVADTGIGIPAEHLPYIFERFYRVDSSRSRTVSRTGLHHHPAVGLASGRVESDPLAKPRNGSGLGLSICRSIVHGLGGEILAESHPGAGTRVTVLVPTQPTRNRHSKQDRGIV